MTGCGNDSSISERSEYSEACRSIGMAVPRGLLRGYGDRREEASFASKSVDHIKTKKYGKWLKIGLEMGQAYAMCLMCRLVQKLTTNEINYEISKI